MNPKQNMIFYAILTIILTIIGFSKNNIWILIIMAVMYLVTGYWAWRYFIKSKTRS